LPVAEAAAFLGEPDSAGALRRVVLGCSYDGSGFHGFADQPGQLTIAGALRAVLERVAGIVTPITVAGRTDAGVHARTQVLHVDLPVATVERFALPPAPGSPFGPELPGLARSLRRQLPPSISVFRAVVAPEGFDARFSAVARRYRYDLVTSDRMDPSRRATSWMLERSLDYAAMVASSDLFCGEHDFAAFARRPKGTTGPILRRVTETAWSSPEDDLIRFEIEAQAFAHQMVRSIVGALVAIGTGRLRRANLVEYLRRGVRIGLPTPAPAHGLMLIAVEYPPELGGRWS
jgi:tRNA pseudouridine38-40 synthase